MSVRSLQEALDSRAFETAVRAETTIKEHQRASLAREERRDRETREFRQEMRRNGEVLRAGLADVHERINAIHRWIRTVLTSLVVGLLGTAGFLFAKVMGW